MKDPVALAWSGRIGEARVAALEQIRSDDPLIVRQALESFAVLGNEHGVRADAELDDALAFVSRQLPLESKALDAAAALDSAVLDDVIEKALREGRHGWALLRHVGDRPSLRFARALAEGWAAIPDDLRDLALLTSRVLPVATAREAASWGERALKHVNDPIPENRAAAFAAIEIWAPAGAVAACERGLEDESAEVRIAAARALKTLSLSRLRELADGENASPEVWEVLGS